MHSVAAWLLLAGLAAAHQYQRGFIPNPTGWSIRRQGVATSFWPGPRDHLVAAETAGPYPAWGKPAKQNSVTTSDSVTSCQVGTKVYKVGDKWTPDNGCGRVACLEGGKTSTLGCPEAVPGEPCGSGAPDSRQPWPLCCPQVRC